MPTLFSTWLHRAYVKRLNPVESRACVVEAQLSLSNPKEEAELLADAWRVLFGDLTRAVAALRLTNVCTDTEVWIRRVDLLQEWVGEEATPHIVEALQDADATGSFSILHETILRATLSMPNAGVNSVAPFIILNEGKAKTLEDFASCVVECLYAGSVDSPSRMESCHREMERRAVSIFEWLACAESRHLVSDPRDRILRCIQQAVLLQRTWKDRAFVAHDVCLFFREDPICEQLLTELASYAVTPEQKEECRTIRAVLTRKVDYGDDLVRWQTIPDEMPPSSPDDETEPSR